MYNVILTVQVPSLSTPFDLEVAGSTNIGATTDPDLCPPDCLASILGQVLERFPIVRSRQLRVPR